MNSGVIIKIEFCINGEEEYQEMDFVPNSGNFTESMEETEAGNVFSFESGFKIAEINPDTDSILNGITGRRASFRITDANGRVYTVGDSMYRARFTFSRRMDGTPGSFNGYECRITRKSPTACPAV